MYKTLVVGFLLIGSLFGAQTVEISGDKAYPPYSYFEKGEAKGVYVDVIKAAFEKMPDYEVKFNMVAWKRAIALIKSGKTVGFFPPFYNEERTAWTKFSEPILKETTVVFAKEETISGKVKFPEDFYGMKACLNRGFSPLNIGGEGFVKAIKDGKIELVEANDNKACLSRVARGLVGFYLSDQLIDISKFPKVKKGMMIKGNDGHVGFTLKGSYPFMDDFQMKFNKVIKDMKASGEVDKILQNYK